jgi:hypothetical protein
MSQFKVKAMIDPKKAAKDVSINTADLQNEFVEQAGYFAYYSTKAAQADRQESMAKMARDRVHAVVDAEIRKQAIAEKEKVTEAVIKHRVNLDDRYRVAAEARIDAAMVTNLCKGNVDAFRNKRDMLIQIGANDRHDQKGSLRTLGDQGRELVTKAGASKV